MPHLISVWLATNAHLKMSSSQPLAIASGLSVGKEGPSVHMACCVGNVIGGFFERFATSHSAFACERLFLCRLSDALISFTPLSP